MKDTVGPTQDAPIVKVGHTFSNVFGSEPNAKVKGRDKPTEQTFGGASK
jgi:hypothetical protein